MKNPLQPIRKTKRLIVRRLNSKDFANWLRAESNCLPMQDEFDRVRPKKQLTRKLFDHQLKIHQQTWKGDVLYKFGVFSRESGELIGSMDLLTVQRLHFQCANLGYALYNRHWGNGFAVEAALAVMDIGFRDLHFHRIEALMNPDNKRSVKVAKSLGMTKEGRRRGFFFRDKKWHSAEVYSLLAEEHGIRRYKAKIRTRLDDLI